MKSAGSSCPYCARLVREKCSECSPYGCAWPSAPVDGLLLPPWLHTFLEIRGAGVAEAIMPVRSSGDVADLNPRRLPEPYT